MEPTNKQRGKRGLSWLPGLRPQPAKNVPETKFVAGGISATVWRNVAHGKDGETEYRTIQFQRRYKDAQGNWKSSDTLRMHDVPIAVLILQKAFEHLVFHREHPRKEQRRGDFD